MSPSAGAPWATVGTLRCRAAPARGVTAARMALSTVTVTAGPGSASAGQGPRGSAVRTVNQGTFWWRATVCVGITPLKDERWFLLPDGFPVRRPVALAG